MPITVQAPEGLLSDEAERTIIEGLTNAILEINGAAENPLARKHLIAAVLTIPKGKTFADGTPTQFINVALRVPTFSLPTHDHRATFVTAITDIIEKAAGGILPRDRIYVNMLYGDGFWGIGGETYTDSTLLQALDDAAGAK